MSEEDLEVGLSRYDNGYLYLPIYNANLEAIINIPSLRELEMSSYDRDLSLLRKVKTLRVLAVTEVTPNVKSCRDLCQLESLIIPLWDPKDLRDIEHLKQLKHLDISSYRGKSIEGLASLENLEELKLSSFKGDFSPLFHLIKLRRVIVNKIYKKQDLAFLGIQIEIDILSDTY